MADYSPSDSVATPIPGAAGPASQSDLIQQYMNEMVQQLSSPSQYTAASIAQQNPSLDPMFLSFLRGRGASDAQARAQMDRQNATIEAQLNAQRPVWEEQTQSALKNIGYGAAGRGMYNSSERLDTQAKAQSDINRQKSMYEQGIKNQEMNNADAYQANLANLQMQQGTQELAARQRLAQAATQQGMQ